MILDTGGSSSQLKPYAQRVAAPPWRSDPSTFPPGSLAWKLPLLISPHSSLTIRRVCAVGSAMAMPAAQCGLNCVGDAFRKASSADRRPLNDDPLSDRERR